MKSCNTFVGEEKRFHSIIRAGAITALVVLAKFSSVGAEVRFSASQYDVSETASVVTVRAVRDESVGVAGVKVQINGGSAQSPANYYLKTDVISFPDGADTADLSVFIVDNAETSGDHDISLELVSETEGVTVGSPGTATIVIVDNDAEGFPGLGFSGHYFFEIVPNYSFASRVNALVPDGQGRWLAAGEFTSVNGHARTNLVRLLADGSLDDSFNPYFTTDGQIYPVAFPGDGKILIGGQFTKVNGSAAGRIAQLLPDGTLDSGFAHGTGFTSATVETLEVLADGRILVGGNFSAYGGVPRRTVAILNADGSLDESFDPDSVSYLIGGHGAIQAGTGFVVITHGPGETNFVFRLNGDGSKDDGFTCEIPNDFSSSVTGIHLQSDGRMVIVGEFTLVNGVARNNVARLNADGSTDESFDPGTGADNRVRRVFPSTGDKLLIVGNFTEYDGQPRSGVAMINEDGSLDMSFNPGTGASGSVNTGFVIANGTVLLGGGFAGFDGVDRFGLVALNADGSIQLQEPRFVGIGSAGEDNVLARLLCEPNFDVELFESTSLPDWQSIGTQRSPRPIIEVVRPVSESGQLFYRAEQLVP